ncbi:putative L-selectin-like [Triplophysa rosa]|uniref:L-selectin-like n=1 Tax=Triplophysa rosa TaxID=992332 RepID=A0A9W7T3J6_TRIRA|nr:putative L-selectin-like [Triplophysa rosa]
MERLFHLLLFSGLWSYSQTISHGYVLIQEQKTWDKAQLYCRQNHIDLVTFQSNTDWTHVRRAIQTSLPVAVWTGLNNKDNSWWWSYPNETLTTFLGWNSGEPNNTDGKQDCVIITPEGWCDLACSYKNPFFCYNANITYEREQRDMGYNGLSLGQYPQSCEIWLNWHNARYYCIEHHTDLAFIRTQAENDQLLQMMQGFDTAWIGLFRSSWKWSDRTTINMSRITWKTGQPNITGINRPCGAADPDGLIDDQLCSDALPFICLTRTKKQIVRLEVKSSKNLNDPAMMESITQSIKQKMNYRGIKEDIRLTWKLQPGGNVFAPKHNCEENLEQKDCADLNF